VSRLVLAATLLALLPVVPPAAAAQPGGGAAEQQFVESLRRSDPAAAERFVALRDAREQAIADLQRVQAQYAAAGPELRSVFLGRLRQARRTYVERSLALLDFLDARDREAITRYREAIDQIDAALADRQRSRADLEQMLKAE
jgi:hypothetical protein